MRVVVTTGGRLAEAAREDGVPVIPLPAGLQPRAAVAYMIVSALEVATLAGVAQGVRTEIDAAAAGARAPRARSGGRTPTPTASRSGSRSGSTARACACTGPVPTGAVATRWKTQLNENAKIPAFAAELPEADHNEIVGWQDASALGSFTAVFLEDVDQHPRVRQRIELTAALIEPQAAGHAAPREPGRRTRSSGCCRSCCSATSVSIYLAVLRGIDPTPVEPIERLKAALARAEVA